MSDGSDDSASRRRGRPSAQDTGSTAGHDDLAVRLSELARDLQHEDDTDSTLTLVVQGAVDLIPGAEAGSISVVVDRKKIDSQAPSGELPRRVDMLQSETQQGPGLDAAYRHQTVRVDDMRTETRWPLFAQRAYRAGAGSMLSIQLYVEGDNLGALNLYAAAPGAFDDESEHVGLMFAAHAAVAFAGVNQHDRLTRALATRDLIGQATGILMERYKITGDQAFRLMVRVSQDTNRKLRDVADQLVRSGDWPVPPGDYE